MFERVDANGDGVIDRQEFAQAVKHWFKNRRDAREGDRDGRAGRRDRIGRGEDRRSDDRRGEGRRGERRCDWQCPNNPQGECFGGPPARANCFDGPRGFDGPRDKAGRHERRGEWRQGDGRGPMMDCSRDGNRRGMGDGFHRELERMIKDAVAEALGDSHAGPPMGMRDRGAKGEGRRAKDKDRGPDRKMKRDCDFGMMPPNCDPAQCGDRERERDRDGRRGDGQRGERGPRGDRAERFQKLDRNGDGMISLEEFNAAPNRDGFDKADGDGPRGEKGQQKDDQRRRGGRGSDERGPRN